MNPIHVDVSEGFVDWLASERVSLAISTYQSGRLIFIGQRDGRLSIVERRFPRCMGLWSNGQTLWMSSLYQVWRFENLLPEGAEQDGFDRVYVPQAAWTTGDIDVHDVAMEADGRVVFASTLFNGLATISETHSFHPVWKPPFIDRWLAEDRCHLNGLALRDGRVRYVTLCSDVNERHSWRNDRYGGGRVMEIDTGETIADALSMPHSPRYRDERLWVLNSGEGELGYLEDGRFEDVCWCPGYLRGLAFTGQYALTGMSRPRAGSYAFHGLPLEGRMGGEPPCCGVQVVDLNDGTPVHRLDFGDSVDELYDVVVLPGVTRPMGLGVRSEEIGKTIRIGPMADGA